MSAGTPETRAEKRPEEQLWDLYRDAFTTRGRLALPRGNFSFNVQDERYARLEFVAVAYDNMYVTLHENPLIVDTDLQGRPYTRRRWHSVGIKRGDVWYYQASDALAFTSDFSDHEFEDELSSVDEELDPAQPLPVHVRTMLDDMRRLLPTVALDQIDDENTEEWPDDDDDYRYDRRKVQELQELEQALSTAGGAMYLMQLAVLMRHRRSRRKNKNTEDFAIPSTNSVYSISASFDPGPGETKWHPHAIEVRGTSWGGNYGSGEAFQHETLQQFVEYEDHISYQIMHSLVRDNDAIPITVDVYDLATNDKLPQNALELVKHMLKEIMGIKR